MPELPEVQTIVNDLQILTGDVFTGFWTNFNKAVKSKNLAKELVGRKIKSVRRIGKNIVIELPDEKFLVLHLKMTGKLIISKQPKIRKLKPEAVSKHLHHIFFLKNNGSIEFHDIRKFATLEIINKEDFVKFIDSKGTDPLSEEFNMQKFIQLLNERQNKNIKSFLMDQTAISGIGNIYASEIPFDAKINPHRKIKSLSESEALKLYKSILKILKKAILLRGTSFSDYRDAKNLRGSFQNHLKVYKKAGKNCSKCGTIIEKSVVEQRSTFYCPTCQK